MNSELLEFSKTLDTEHFQAAVDMRNELLEDHINEPELVITTKQLYKNAFVFPGVSEYENVNSQLTDVQNAQDNLNQNQDNPVLMDKFVKVATKVRQNFKNAYKDGWIDHSTTV